MCVESTILEIGLLPRSIAAIHNMENKGADSDYRSLAPVFRTKRLEELKESEDKGDCI